MEQTEMLIGNFWNLTPEEDHLGAAQAFCDP